MHNHPGGNGKTSDANSQVRTPIEMLDRLIGQHQLKESVHELLYSLQLEKERSERIGNHFNASLNILLVGSIGTGKSKVSQILATILQSAGYTKNDVCITATINDFILPYAGQSRLKTKEILESAAGGILILQGLDSHLGNDDHYTAEALEVLQAHLSMQNNFICIASAEPDGIKELFAKYAYLETKFNYRFNFETYTAPELSAICLQMIEERGMLINKNLELFLQEYFLKIYERKGAGFQQALTVHNIVTESLRKQQIRLMQIKDKPDFDQNELLLLKPEDFI